MADKPEVQPALLWRKSSASGVPEECVEVAFQGSVVHVRDSTDPLGPVLTFSRCAWQAFLTGLRCSEADPSR